MKLKFYPIKRFAVFLLLLAAGSAADAQVLTRTVADYNTGEAYTQSGNPIKYTLTITNDLQYTFINLQYLDEIPYGTTYYPGTTEVNGVAVPDVNGHAPFIDPNWMSGLFLPLPGGVGVLPPGQTATITYVVIVNANAGVIRTFYGQARADYNGDQGFLYGFQNVSIPLVDDFSCSAAYITNGSSATATSPNSLISAINIEDGTRVNQVFSGSSTNYFYANTNTRMPLGTQLLTDASAIAFDNDNQRLYFVNNSTTTQQELYYVNVGSSPVRTYKFSNTTPYYFPVTPGVGKNITRMTWTPFGVGYALTDDGQQLIRFSVTNNVPTFTDLGPVLDLNANQPPVINETGGDIAADWYGNLFLVTNSGKLYTIMMDEDIPVAVYEGTPSGLPATGNNSVTIAPNGRLLVGGAYQNAYSISFSGPTATSVTNGATNIFYSGDYASCYYSQMPWWRKAVSEKPATPEVVITEAVRVSPNPFINTLNLKVSLPAAETVKIRLTDMLGRTVYSSTQKLVSGVNTVNVNIPGTLKHGIYLLDVWAGNKRLATKKLSHL